jgi:bifunctional DNA-binding transcriptional regulator/antitoxin component of YhaV-PrlF toxin-antitoxin module
METVVDESGRIQLPEDVRSQLGVGPGDHVILEPRAGEWVLKAAHASAALSWEGNVLVHQGTSTPGAAAESLIDQARDERFRQLTEGFSP